MKTQLISLAIATAVMTSSVQAEDNQRGSAEGGVGFLSGMAVGAAAGGPIGAVVGGAVGAFLGEHSAKSAEALDIAEAKASETKRQNTALIAQLTSLETQLSLAQASLLKQRLFQELKVNLQFKTNSDEIAPIYDAQLQKIASVLKKNPELKINLAGFADRNGEEQFNLSLSEKRVAAVKAKLKSLGVTERSMSTQAYGETAPLQAQQDLQSDFYDRRVEVLLQPQPHLTADNN